MKDLRTFNPIRDASESMKGIEREYHGGSWTTTKMCWKCQKDKYTKGGSNTRLGPSGMQIARFICRDCLPQAAIPILPCNEVTA